MYSLFGETQHLFGSLFTTALWIFRQQVTWNCVCKCGGGGVDEHQGRQTEIKLKSNYHILEVRNWIAMNKWLHTIISQSNKFGYGIWQHNIKTVDKNGNKTISKENKIKRLLLQPLRLHWERKRNRTFTKKLYPMTVCRLWLFLLVFFQCFVLSDTLSKYMLRKLSICTDSQFGC